MIERPVFRTCAILSVAALAPSAAAVVAAFAGVSPIPIALIAVGVSVVSIAVGVVLTRRLWRPIQTDLNTTSALLTEHTDSDKHSEEVDSGETLPALARAAIDNNQRASASQRDQIHWLDLIIDSLGEPVLAVDHDETIVFANETASDFFQIESAKQHGSAASSVITHSALRSALHRGLAGEHHMARIDLATRRGARIYDLVCAPIAMDQHAAGAILILRDVTDLARAARMKTDFVANASHELRTPLAAIRAALDTARLASDNDPKLMRRFIDITPAHLNRIEEMTRDLIDLSRLENPELRIASAPMSLKALSASLTSLLQEQASQRPATIAFELTPELEGFGADERLVHLTLKNLIDNALKYCDEGSTVRIVGGLVSAEQEPRRARFEVRNKGVGVPLDQQERIFERFYQIDSAKLGALGHPSAPSGTGLGLSIVKHAIGAMGGELGVDSVYKQGATFWFEIPEFTA